MSEIIRQAPSLRVRDRLIVDLTSLAALCALALCAGLASNRFRDEGVAIPHKSKKERFALAVLAATPAASGKRGNGQQEPAGRISPAEFSALLRAGQTLGVDARAELFHQAGHIAGAVSLPRARFDKAYPPLRLQLEEASRRHKPIVVYCQNAQCEDSELVAAALEQLGFANVLVLHGGFRAWEAAGLPVERGQP
jgi:rhodanese-related sulfurtransferase